MIYDAIVVGAGVEGSATAYQLAKRGRHVLLLEQYKLGHNRGSSHSLTRITRKAYGTRDFFTSMMKDAYRQTDELQAECGEQLFYNTGCMILGKKCEEFLEGTEVSLKRHDVPYERFDSASAKARFPNLSYPAEFEYIIDKSGGVLRADRVLRAFQTGFEKHGGNIRDEEEMVDIYHGGDIVTVKTNKGLHKTRSLILTLGPWASKWLPRIGVHIPIQTTKVLVCYWKEKIPGEYSFTKFPTFIDVTTSVSNFHVYGLPSNERPGYIKICLHGGSPADPDKPDATNVDWIKEAMGYYVAKHFPTLEDKPAFVEECFYTNTPDEGYVLDTHPAWKNVIIGTGFSGQGFKLAPVVGCILADLAEGKQPNSMLFTYYYCHFELSFEKVVKHSEQDHSSQILKVRRGEINDQTGQKDLQTLNFSIIPDIIKKSD